MMDRFTTYFAIAAVSASVWLVSDVQEAEAQVAAIYTPHVVQPTVTYMPVRRGLFGLRRGVVPVAGYATVSPAVTTYRVPAVATTTYYAPAPVVVAARHPPVVTRYAPPVVTRYAPPVVTRYAPPPVVTTRYAPVFVAPVLVPATRRYIGPPIIIN